MRNKEKSYKTYDDFKKAISDAFKKFVYDDEFSMLNFKDLGVQDEKDSEDDF